MTEQEKLIALSNDARLVNLAEQLIFPLIENMRQRRVETMLHKYADSKHEYLADVAYIAALNELMQHLRLIQSRGNKAISNIK